MTSRSLVNETSIQGLGLSIQVFNISLDKRSGQENSIELRLLGDNRCQSSGNLRNKSVDSSNNSISFFSSDSTRYCTTISTSLLETSFKDLFLGVDGKSTAIATSTSENIDLLIVELQINKKYPLIS